MASWWYNSHYYYYYYQVYQLGTGRFHKKAKPVRCVTQSQREPIGIKQGRTLLNLKSKKNPLQGRTKPAGHLDSGQAPHSVGQPGGASYRVNSSGCYYYYYQVYRLGTGGFHTYISIDYMHSNFYWAFQQPICLFHERSRLPVAFY